MSCLYGSKLNLRHVLKQCLEVKCLKYLKSSYANLLVDFVTADVLFKKKNILKPRVVYERRTLKGQGRHQKASHILQQFQTITQTELVI